MIGMALPDPKLEKAFGVLPLSAGDAAATGEQIHWYQDWARMRTSPTSTGRSSPTPHRWRMSRPRSR